MKVNCFMIINSDFGKITLRRIQFYTYRRSINGSRYMENCCGGIFFLKKAFHTVDDILLQKLENMALKETY